MGKKGCSKIQNNKLNTYDWLCDVPDAANATDYVEVQFKNTRKGYYLNSSKIPLEKGDLVAVEASPGHDIGTVTLTGKLVLLQMKKNNVRTGEGNEPKKVYRKAKPTDIEKYEGQGTRHNDPFAPDRCRFGTEYEDRGCGIPG